MIAKRYPESLTEFQKVLGRDPNFGPAHYKLAALYATTGRFADAETEFEKFIRATGSYSPDAQGYCKLAVSAQYPSGDTASWPPHSPEIAIRPSSTSRTVFPPTMTTNWSWAFAIPR